MRICLWHLLVQAVARYGSLSLERVGPAIAVGQAAAAEDDDDDQEEEEEEEEEEEADLHLNQIPLDGCSS